MKGIMADDPIEQPAATTGAGEPTRLQRIQQFFFNQFHDLEHVAYDTYPQLDFRDCEKVLLHLSERLLTFTGPLDADAFGVWACSIVAQQASRYRITKAESCRLEGCPLETA